MLVHRIPQAADEARGPLHPLVGPFERLLGGRGEHDEEPRGVGAKALDQTFGIDAVALGLRDRKSTRLNSSHRCISYAVFCLKKKKKNDQSSRLHLLRLSVTPT